MRSEKRLRRLVVAAAFATTGAAATLAGLASAGPGDPPSFNHTGTFSVPANLPGGMPIDTPTSAEIVDATPDGRTLVYTDSPLGAIGFIDIASAAAPAPDGTIDVGGEPTSVAVVGEWALVAVNTSQDFDSPSGELAIVNTASRAIVERLPLAGQPDSIDISPDERYAAIVIENERDEDENDGLIPQLPAGALQVLDLKGGPGAWSSQLRTVGLTGLAAVAPSDPEPEYVDINTQNEAAVTLQENNHIVVVDLEHARVKNDFSAGTVELVDVDATEEELGPQENGLIVPGETIVKRREPDGVAWIDKNTFATANEGDYEDDEGEGGARGFTLFNQNGAIEYESGAGFEHELVRIGHYPEGRSENKGNEPEGIEVGVFGKRKLLFVGSERANVVGVYDVTHGSPELLQLLPTGMGPEGIKAIPGRNLLAVSAEVDGKDEDPGDQFDVRSLVTLYRLEPKAAVYPYLRSADDEGLPIPWVAISGLAGDPHDAKTLWAVSDSFLAQAYVYRIDVSSGRGVIEERIPVGGYDVDNLLGDFDLEGIAARPEGGFWLASEGRTGSASKSRPNLLIRTEEDGTIVETVELPTALAAQATSSGLEGVAVTGTGDEEVVWVVVQREWDDAGGFVKIGRYDVASGAWSFALYPLDAVESPNGGWVGLSEVAVLGEGGRLAIVERDNQIGLDARIKRIYAVDPAHVTWKEYGEPLDTVSKTLVRDALAELDVRSISLPDKLEGLGIAADGRVFLATDNDGVDENYGETLFFETSLGE